MFPSTSKKENKNSVQYEDITHIHLRKTTPVSCLCYGWKKKETKNWTHIENFFMDSFEEGALTKYDLVKCQHLQKNSNGKTYKFLTQEQHTSFWDPFAIVACVLFYIAWLFVHTLTVMYEQFPTNCTAQKNLFDFFFVS